MAAMPDLVVKMSLDTSDVDRALDDLRERLTGPRWLRVYAVVTSVSTVALSCYAVLAH